MAFDMAYSQSYVDIIEQGDAVIIMIMMMKMVIMMIMMIMMMIVWTNNALPHPPAVNFIGQGHGQILGQTLQS